MTLRGMAVSAAAAGLLLSGCANDGTLTTAAITPKPASTATAAAVDPQCATLASQIDTLRKEGSVERLEKAAAGKAKSVQVKREALVKQAELNKAHADFQMKCGPKIPTATAQATPAPTPQSAATAATASAAQPAATSAAKTAAKDVVKQQ